jgi:hypothetical protein
LVAVWIGDRYGEPGRSAAFLVFVAFGILGAVSGATFLHRVLYHSPPPSRPHAIGSADWECPLCGRSNSGPANECAACAEP